jgi:hypothetical protein
MSACWPGAAAGGTPICAGPGEAQMPGLLRAQGHAGCMCSSPGAVKQTGFSQLFRAQACEGTAAFTAQVVLQVLLSKPAPAALTSTALC